MRLVAETVIIRTEYFANSFSISLDIRYEDPGKAIILIMARPTKKILHTTVMYTPTSETTNDSSQNGNQRAKSIKCPPKKNKIDIFPLDTTDCKTVGRTSARVRILRHRDVVALTTDPLCPDVAIIIGAMLLMLKLLSVDPPVDDAFSILLVLLFLEFRVCSNCAPNSSTSESSGPNNGVARASASSSSVKFTLAEFKRSH
ncbi:unnamed protein product [Pseudo-nitzschia multistriata]|uniref:Uncharacterized protein n=1 Tax=Pseudo-nitzschia multistriata TaxID=183589 RepID=A0A448ZKM5_9STRA|nr:unnamed protein product [Pseudo-nitzschia multistriata]